MLIFDELNVVIENVVKGNLYPQMETSEQSQAWSLTLVVSMC